MEAATHAMAPKTSNMCDTHTVYEAAPAEMTGTKATIHTFGATHAMTETVTCKMGDIYAAVSETVTSEMGDIYAAVSETVTSEMGDTYAADTHAVMDDAPISADAHVSEAVARVPAIKYGGVAVIAVIPVIPG
jgi:hypothetical protein